jgi:hypothetical protein
MRESFSDSANRSTKPVFPYEKSSYAENGDASGYLKKPEFLATGKKKEKNSETVFEGSG